jgi:hypothetical protein
MSFPQDEGEFYLDTDASDTAIGILPLGSLKLNSQINA